MNSKKLYRVLISLVLVFTICFGTCTNGFAATGSGGKYIKEVIISYGDTADEAKAWLTENGYEVLDKNLNEGADDTFSTARAVYLGYTTTNDANEAITDMKLMNMKGGYSVQDYQMLLDEQKTNIRNFFKNFKVAVKEFRENYNAGQARAIAAYETLNLLYDDDTQQNIGDLLLNKVREEYTDEEYNALSDEEKAKVGDMTTILMQGNADAVLTIEQTIATATDDSDTLWTERYQDAKTYDEMVDELMESKNLTVDQAEKELASEYDADAKLIAANFDSYKDYLGTYTNADISFTNSVEEIEAYADANEDFNMSEWFAVGTQYEVLSVLENDDVSLLDLITSDEYDVENGDRYMLYPLVASLTDGQRACLEFLPTYQLVALGINSDEATEARMEQLDVSQYDGLQNVSVYANVDRSMFSDDIALTGDAYRLQNSTGENASGGTSSAISTPTIVLLSSLACSTAATAFCWTYGSHLKKLSSKLSSAKFRANYDVGLSKNTIRIVENRLKTNLTEAERAINLEKLDDFNNMLAREKQTQSAAISAYESNQTWQKIFQYASIAMTCVTIALMVASLWSTWQDLQEYYNVDFTPIPSKMVNQGVDDNDKKVYTYYSAVKCNRVDQGMVTDSTKLLGDYGDLNGDVGRQWVALYTTTDKAAGDPITTDFTVQYNDTNLPNDDSTALSIFCESTAQNLTNEQAGYTYADSKDGIYLFYETDSSVFAGSVFTGGNYVLVGGLSALVAAVIFFFIGQAVGKNGRRKKETANA
jgi:hypothetical protein